MALFAVCYVQIQKVWKGARFLHGPGAQHAYLQAEGASRREVHRALDKADSCSQRLQRSSMGTLSTWDAMYMCLHVSRDVGMWQDCSIDFDWELVLQRSEELALAYINMLSDTCPR